MHSGPLLLLLSGSCFHFIQLIILEIELKQECRFLSRSRINRTRSIGFNSLPDGNRTRITAFFFNPAQDPLVKEAFKVF